VCATEDQQRAQHSKLRKISYKKIDMMKVLRIFKQPYRETMKRDSTTSKSTLTSRSIEKTQSNEEDE